MLNKIRKLQNKKGFTLVELIVVIAIIAILTAVIVPLVGRYSAQATYTTLQDGAQTISTNVATCLSDATKNGTVLKLNGVTGTKASGTLTITLYDATNTAVTPAAGSQEAKLVTAIQESLGTAVDNGGSFTAKFKKNAVEAVIYRKSGDSVADNNYLTTAPSVTADTDFEEAYLLGSAAVGVQGAWKVASAPAGTTTT